MMKTVRGFVFLSLGFTMLCAWMVGVSAHEPHHSEDQGMPKIFRPMAWGATENDVRKIYSGYLIKTWEIGGGLRDERGREVSGVTRVVSVQGYPVLGGLAQGAISFHSRKDYRFVSIEVEFDWGECGLLDAGAFHKKASCQARLKRFHRIRHDIQKTLEKEFRSPGRKYSKSELDDPGAEIFEWRQHGLEYVFIWEVSFMGAPYAMNLLIRPISVASPQSSPR